MKFVGAFLFAAGALAAAPPTFNHDVAPILYQNCTTCHRPGQVAPFSLLTYADAAKRAKQISAVTSSHYMPPWKPAPGYGDFHDARVLTDEQIKTLRDWAKAGAPQGDPTLNPVSPQFSSEWRLGPPDLVVKMPQPFEVPADGADIYQCMVLPLNLASDMNVSAVEVRPGNPRVVHHAILYLDDAGRARQRDAATPEPGYRCFGGPGFTPSGSLGGWAPGANPEPLPDGVARSLKKSSDLVVQLHYHPSGKTEQDQTSIGIYFAKTPTTKNVYSLMLLKRDLAIPAGVSDYKVHVELTLPIAVEANGITPHMHLLGKEMRVRAILPSGVIQPLIWVKDWDFNWQGQYQFEHVVPLPAGTKLELDAVYDNSAANPRNPHNPPVAVHWGENTTDEMAIAFLQYQTANPADRATLLMSMARQLDLWKYARNRQ